ncbi:class I SAM-dependent methyltransferase [Streptomyces sp. SID3343]|uniref:class I SAM-dependent DNA methyltransferase n=1 Tax=Streptomyces sp. SID3343 TaxID=2690260 RepID=UPI00136DDD45|nr:class I SAM-dependent methyltransferase [Streptomyces sp. SID3343]MYW03049.1 methyltransferase domain-containing protein [Streptomyces sp. SID3343]
MPLPKSYTPTGRNSRLLAPTPSSAPTPDSDPHPPAPPGGTDHPAPPGSGPGYADTFAADYDRWFGKPGITGATVDALVGLSGTGPVLELGVGTGRIALALSQRGIRVHGIDASEAMIRRLRDKPGGTEITVHIGDFSHVDVPDRYSLIYLAGGTFFELADTEAKQRCLAAARARLKPGGLLVFDAHLPEALAVASASGTPEVVAETDERLILCHRRIDASTQTYQSHYLIHEADRTRHLRVAFHYASPGELDLMAHKAGLRLVRRQGTWAGAPFTRESAYHVSVYEIGAAEES